MKRIGYYYGHTGQSNNQKEQGSEHGTDTGQIGNFFLSNIGNGFAVITNRRKQNYHVVNGPGYNRPDQDP